MTDHTFGITAFASHLGAQKDVANDWLPRFGTEERKLTKVHQTGLTGYRALHGASIKDAVLCCLDKLFSDLKIQIDLVLFSHTLASSIPPAPFDLIHEISCRYPVSPQGMAIGQLQCALPCLAMDIMDRIFALEQEVERVLLITADICIDDLSRCDGGTMFESDGVVAAVFTRGAGRLRHVASSVIVESCYFDNEARDRSFLALGQYAATSVQQNARCLDDTLAKAGWTHKDVQHYIPFSGHPRRWQAVCQAVGIDQERIRLPNMAEVGHLFCSDMLFNLWTTVTSGVAQSGDRVACATLGEGRTFGCSLFEI